MSSQNDDPMIGRVLAGDYEIQRLIGKGGMAYVYKGRDTSLDRDIAVKVITLQRDRATELMKRFQREARVISKLDRHPNIIRVHRFGTENNDTHYLVMELIRGETLTQRLKRYRRKTEFMPYKEVVNIMRQVAEAIDHVHRHDAIHRDIKPSNIMIEKETERAVLMDFGLVMDFANNTTLGTAFGTPRYIAPEQAISSQQAVPQSDIYSLGIIIYEMLAGSTPFDEDSAMSMALSHITNPPPHPQHFRDELPDEIAQVVLKAIEKQPEDRFQTAREMVDALEAAVEAVSDVTADEVALPIVDASVDPDAATVRSDSWQPPQEESGTLSGSAQQAPAVPSPLPTHANRPEPAEKQSRRRRPVLLGAVVMIVLVGFVGALLTLSGSGNGGTQPTPTIEVVDDPMIIQEDDLWLLYNQQALFIYNTTEEPIDLTSFRFELPDRSTGLTLLFFGDETGVIQPLSCIKVSIQREISENPDVCNEETLIDIEHARKVQADYYWVWDSTVNEAGTFLISTNDIPIRECMISTGECSFSVLFD